MKTSVVSFVVVVVVVVVLVVVEVVRGVVVVSYSFGIGVRIFSFTRSSALTKMQFVKLLQWKGRHC
jgi:hypothetical protein